MTTPGPERCEVIVSTSFEMSGSGPDLLLLHGWASSRRLWQRVIPGLTAHFRCWALDLPGFGATPPLAAAGTLIESYSAWLADFCAEHGIEHCGVVGHSMGGALTLQFAADQPKRVRALAAINPVVTGRLVLNILDVLPNRPGWMHGSQALSKRVVGPLAAAPLPETVRAALWPLQRRIEDFVQADEPMLLDTWDLLTGFDIRPRLATVEAPALVVLGSLDMNVPNSEGLSAVAALPNARVIRFTAGHTIMDLYPRVVARALADYFLAHLS